MLLAQNRYWRVTRSKSAAEVVVFSIMEGGVGNRVFPHPADPVPRFQCSDQYGPAVSLGAGYHIEAVVHPVDEIHIGDASGAEHDCRPFRNTPERVGCGIVLSVCLGFDDSAGKHSAGDGPHHIFTQ